jgi:hypothetical protein
MSVASVLARGRAAAEQLMVDTCLIERHTGRVFNSVTGVYDDVWTQVYSGPCRVKGGARSSGGRDAEFGEHEATLHAYEIRLPWDTTPEIKREDRLTVTTSDDTWVIGRLLEIVDVAFSGTTTSRRIAAEDRS